MPPDSEAQTAGLALSKAERKSCKSNCIRYTWCADCADFVGELYNDKEHHSHEAKVYPMPKPLGRHKDKPWNPRQLEFRVGLCLDCRNKRKSTKEKIIRPIEKSVELAELGFVIEKHVLELYADWREVRGLNVEEKKEFPWNPFDLTA